MSQVLETVIIYRDGQPLVINKSDFKATDKQKGDKPKHIKKNS